jgi:hypothetical protein
MKELQELIQIVNKNKAKRIEVIGHPNNYKSYLNDLYEGIADGKFQLEDDAIDFFYGNSDNGKKNFSRLKSRLKDRLYNTLFFINTDGDAFTENEKAYYECHKNYALIKILLGRNARNLAIKLAEGTIKKTTKFEFSDLTVHIAGVLRRHYGAIAGDLRKYHKFTEIMRSSLDTYQKELLAEDYYLDLAINYVNSRSTKVEVEEKAVQYSNELRLLLSEFSSYKFCLFSYSVLTLRHQIINDYLGTIKVCNEAVEAFKNRPHLASRTAIHNFLFYTLRSCIPLRLFKKGESTAQECMKYAPPGSTNWFITLEQYIILSFHSGKYEKAYEIFLEVKNNDRFNSLPDNNKEYWYIHEALINYLIVQKKISRQKSEPKFKFKVGKFLNELPTFSKDKRGTNITILIIQVLFLLQKKEYPKVIDRVEALNVYCHRYLRRDDTFRSNCFIKMLLQLPSAHFNKIAAKRKGMKYYKQLTEVPIQIAKQSNEIEIIPYETLWEFVLENLDTNFN